MLYHQPFSYFRFTPLDPLITAVYVFTKIVNIASYSQEVVDYDKTAVYVFTKIVNIASYCQEVVDYATVYTVYTVGYAMLDH